MSDQSVPGLLFNAYRLRRLRQTIRRDVSDFAVDTDHDPDLLALMEDPFTSMGDVHDRLERLEAELLDRSDKRSIFLTVYTEMTAETIGEIEGGEFGTEEWMRRYLVQFAEYYRQSFLHFERGATEKVPDPWIVAFGTAIRGNALVIQNALLGINAHINYDLALTLSDIGLEPDRLKKYADHNHVNEILARLITIQQELLAERYAPGLARIGERMGTLDELWSAVALRTAREIAWQTAVVRSSTRRGVVERYTDWLLRRTATGGAYLVLHPNISQPAMRVLHQVEADQIDLGSFAREFHEKAQRGI